nr:hypothetical protein [Azospirillum palustre]
MVSVFTTLPTASPEVLPTRLLLDDITPATPVTPLPQAAAPAFVTLPLPQALLLTTKLPLVSVVGEEMPRAWSAMAPYNALISAPVVPLKR